ncbi:Ldh family oxidoreductase [Patescibacteria group bacterium]
MKAKIKEIEKLLIKSASKYVSKAEAIYFAKEQIDTHTKKFPRVKPLETAVSDIESWQKFPKRKIKLLVKKPSSLLFDFNELGPSLKLKHIHDQLEKMAKKNGISMVGLNNSAGIHTLNLWTDGLGKRNLIGICMFNGGPRAVVPYMGTQGTFGTNPISYAIPTKAEPIIVDMASSEIPMFELRQSKENSKKLKPNVAVDKLGKFTTNPDKAYIGNDIKNIVPMGAGYKGYAMVLLIEILTGSLVKSLLSVEMTPKYVHKEHGGLLIAIDISSFTNLNKFKQSVSGMCKIIRHQKSASSSSHVYVPGDLSYQRAERAKKAGKLDISKESFEKLEKLAR